MSNTKLAAESIIIFQDKTCDKTKDFSIFVDNITQNQNETNENPNPPKKYNEDGSLFVYDANQTEMNANRREPLKVISQPGSGAPKFEMTIEQSALASQQYAMNETSDFDPGAASTRFITKTMKNGPNSIENSRIDFEPPASSTCFLKPILKSKDNQKKDSDTKNEVFWHKIADNTYTNENAIISEGNFFFALTNLT